MTKNPSVDLLKGLLILLVIAGHAMELTHQHHMALWVGAGFRMPLILGISGYLLNLDRARNDPPAIFFKRYANRMLLPWAVASVTYIMVSGWQIGWMTPMELVLRPPFHLWYVPVLFLLILVTRLTPLSPVVLLAMGVPISLATMYSFGLDHGPIGAGPLSFDNRYLRYPVYFFFGMLMAERRQSRRGPHVAMTVAALGMSWWAGLYGSDNGLAFVSARLIMCLGLIALLPMLSTSRLFFAPLNAIGRDSLFFYLWHPLVMGVVLIATADAGILIAVSVLLLAPASALAVRKPLLRHLLGCVALSRPVPIAPSYAPLPTEA